MKHDPQVNATTSIRIAELEFEAWPARGLAPNRFCFLHTYLKLSRKDARKAVDPFEHLESRFSRVH